MSVGALMRWLGFTFYILCLFSLPLGILWGVNGILVGSVMGIGLMMLMGFHGPNKVLRQLKAREVAVAEYPALFSILREYARRLKVDPPKVAIMPESSLNMALVGYSDKNAYLIITEGIIHQLPRQGIAALIGRKLTHLSQGELFCETWLCQFLGLAEKFIEPAKPKKLESGRQFFPLRLFLRQSLIYPLCAIPVALLRNRRPPQELDRQTVAMTGETYALGEAFRWVQAYAERTPLHVPFSTRHLFLLAPRPDNPAANVFFGVELLESRIKALDKLNVLRPLAAAPS